MADSPQDQKDFQVKNGLVVNSNNYGGDNKFTVNASAVLFGNTTSNVTITGSSVVVSAPGSTTTFNSNFKPATATLADVSVSVGSIHGANVVSNAQLQANLANFTNTATLTATYQTMAGLSANVAGLTAANSTRLNAKLESQLNVNNAVTSNSSNSATYSDVTGTVGNNGSSTGAQFTFTYAPQLGAPNFVWGTNDGVTYRPYNPANFTATTATTATNVSGGGTVSAVSVDVTSNTLNLGAFSRSANGYTRLPNGLLMQWGTSAIINQDSSGTVTFPIAFSATPYCIQITERGGINYGSGGTDTISAQSATSFTIAHGADGNVTFYWLAIGI